MKEEIIEQICDRDNHNDDIFNYGNCLQCGSSNKKYMI